ncbi:MAG TPA: restriction endonuclease subunit S [Candidatus Wunengus sp. YC60]|uniref:restriction endonuclease subunit S n=1 Tax=Candidatus Wunengus sp. YC60 TaxID=3367697 RepID=UPI00402891A6
MSNKILKNYKKVTGQASINQEQLSSFLIHLTSLVEQRAIVARVDKLMAMINELEKQVSEHKEQSEMLMQSVLREAFAKG